MTTQQHPLFTQYPLTGEAEISVGRVPTPYHTYDGQGLFIGGTADLAQVTKLLANETVYPIRTASGKALIGIWVVDFIEASLGAHNELQFSVLVSHQPTVPIADHPLTLLKALFIDDEARMLCYHLWNNTETVVAYNRELLGLNASITDGEIIHASGRKTFHFHASDGTLIFKGEVSVSKQTAPRVGWQMFRLLGLRNTVQAISQPYLGAKVVNTRSDAFPYHMDAQSFVASDTPIVQFFDSTKDRLQFGQTAFAGIDFQPQFIEHFAPFRFVYLMPERVYSADRTP